MNLEELRNIYCNDAGVKQLSDKLSQGKLFSFLKNTAGSSLAFILQGIFYNTRKTQLVILNNKEDAIYFFNDIENITGLKEQVFFFPSSAKTPYQFEETDNANILMRAETLNAINKDNRPKIIVTYPDALYEKVITKQQLIKNTLDIEVSKKYSIDFIDELMLQYNFEKVDFVYAPGQFAVRGGIVDIFSYSNDNPYRIEFFDDEVESIRTFDTITQLSKQKMNRVSILPNIQEKNIALIRESLLQFIPIDTVVWINSIEWVKTEINKKYIRACELYNKQNTLIEQIKPDELYINAEQFYNQLLNLRIVQTGITNELNCEFELNFHFLPQPSFNRNFDLLSQNLNQLSEKNYITLILADNSKQVDRLKNIFTDKHKEIKFNSIKLQIREGFIDHINKIACYTDHQIFERYYRYRLKEGFNKTKEAITLKDLLSLQKGDYVTHIDYGVGQYSGLEKININGKEQEAIRLIYKGGDVLYVSIHSLHRIAKYSGKEGTQPVLHKLGTNTWQTLKAKTKKKVKEIAFDLIKLYARRKSTRGYAFSPDTYLQNELEASFIYEDTPDQYKATVAVKKDMEAPYPMDRLVCGDVGFGKTEIAIRAAFKAVNDSKQVAILCPTTILSLQHYKNFSDRLKDMPCKVDYINRFKSSRKIKETLQKLANGEIDILIGTHRILAKDVKFKDLGLLIIDEEQKFGVAAKDKLKLLKTTVDTLTLTATPIPRTLQFSLMGARDLSVINTPPPNRYPVQTEIQTFNESLIRDKIYYEVQRGGQVFFVHNRIQNIQEIAGLIQRLCPDIRIVVAHGQMNGEKLEEIMIDFMEGMYDVLIATTIIESGIDIPNANTIIINDAHNFGLSDLHQLRGRVGRSNKRAFCVLLTQPMHMLTQEARKRIQAIEQFSDLGSGFSIAMKDLDIRGAGNLLGGEQSGFINELGYETYQKILDEAIAELKEEEFKELYQTEHNENHQYVRDCQIETDMEILIPDWYVNNVNERLVLYRELDSLKNEFELEKFIEKLTDRFGALPAATAELIEALRLRWLAKEIGFEKIVLKNNVLNCYFITKKESPYYQSLKFTKVLNYFQNNHKHVKMEEKNDKLRFVYTNVKDIKQAIEKLKPILN